MRSVGAFGSREIREPGPQTHARPTGGSGFDVERRLKNLFEQLSLINRGRRPDAQALAAVKQDDLIGEFGGQSQFVSDDNYGVTIRLSEMAEALEQLDLRADIEM